MYRSKTLPPLSLTIVGALLSTGALACKDCDEAPAKAKSPAFATALTVTRDAETGRLRAPTAEEAKALAAANQRSAAATDAAAGRAQPLMRSNTGSMKGARLTEEFLSYSVAVRNPDGSVQVQCVEGKPAMKAAISAPVPQSQSRAKLETE